MWSTTDTVACARCHNKHEVTPELEEALKVGQRVIQIGDVYLHETILQLVFCPKCHSEVYEKELAESCFDFESYVDWKKKQ